MRNKIKEIVKKQVYKATYHLLVHKIPPGEDMNDYTEEIFQQSLIYLADYFIDSKRLRSSEKNVLLTLQRDINKKQSFSITERTFHDNLNRIKPAWGEFFGTDRGTVYNAFRYVCQWPCFTNSVRNQIKLKRIKNLEQQTQQRQQELNQKTTHLQQTSQFLKHSHQTTSESSQRSALQFIEIQQLKVENKILKEQLNKAEIRIQQQINKIKDQATPEKEIIQKNNT